MAGFFSKEEIEKRKVQREREAGVLAEARAQGEARREAARVEQREKRLQEKAEELRSGKTSTERFFEKAKPVAQRAASYATKTFKGVGRTFAGVGSRRSSGRRPSVGTALTRGRKTVGNVLVNGTSRRAPRVEEPMQLRRARESRVDVFGLSDFGGQSRQAGTFGMGGGRPVFGKKSRLKRGRKGVTSGDLLGGLDFGI